MSGARRFHIGAFARPARSGGRAVLSGRLPGVGYKPTRGTPVPPCSMPSRTNTLRGRDDRRINLDAHPSNEFQCCEQFACLQPVDTRDAEGEEAHGYQWKSTQLSFTALAFASLA